MLCGTVCWQRYLNECTVLYCCVIDRLLYCTVAAIVLYVLDYKDLFVYFVNSQFNLTKLVLSSVCLYRVMVYYNILQLIDLNIEGTLVQWQF